MNTRKIGSLEVTEVGVGCVDFGRQIDQHQTDEVVEAALDAGLNFFDTADAYGETASETALGHALRNRRDEAVVATKVGQLIDDERRGGGDPAYVRAAVEASLKRLGMDHVDLLQFHQPDPTVPMAETLGVFHQFVIEGKALEIGCTNFSVPQLRKAAAIAKAAGIEGFVSASNQYSLIVRDHECDTLPECERTGLAFIPWYPLFHGMMTGLFKRGEEPAAISRFATTARRREMAFTDHNFDVVEQLSAYAESRGHTMLELVYGRFLAHPALSSVISGAITAEQVRTNAASASWTLTSEEIADVDRIAPRTVTDDSILFPPKMLVLMDAWRPEEYCD